MIKRGDMVWIPGCYGEIISGKVIHVGADNRVLLDVGGSQGPNLVMIALGRVETVSV